MAIISQTQLPSLAVSNKYAWNFKITDISQTTPKNRKKGIVTSVFFQAGRTLTLNSVKEWLGKDYFYILLVTNSKPLCNIEKALSVKQSNKNMLIFGLISEIYGSFSIWKIKKYNLPHYKIKRTDIISIDKEKIE